MAVIHIIWVRDRLVVVLLLGVAALGGGVVDELHGEGGVERPV